MVRVAIDVGPLHGPRTGVGNAVEWTIDAIEAAAGEPDPNHSRRATPIELIRYVTSMRARLGPGERRLPLPAAAAHRTWARTSRPTMDRWLAHPDLVHGTNYVVPPAAAPRLVSVYDCWFLTHPDTTHPDVRRAGEVLRRATADGAHVLASSAATAARVPELLDTDRVHAVHLGPPPVVVAPDDRPRPTLSLGDDPFVLALGTLEPRKNLTTLIAAFALLAADDPAVRVVLAGPDGDDRDRIDAAIGRLDRGFRRRVHRLGRVDGLTKAWLLHHAAVLAYPSLDEGFGFPVLEAQQAGTPVVAADAGSIPEIAGTGALLAPAADAERLAGGLHTVLRDERTRSRLIEAGHRNLDRFSWNETAAAVIDLYRRLAEGSDR